MFDCVTCRSTKSQLIISSLVVLFAIGLYAVPEAFAATYTVENAQGSSVPGCEPDCFIPASLTVSVGDTIVFANNDTAAHTSTSGSPADGPSGAWDSSMVMSGQSYSVTLDTAGTYPYFCMVHPWMLGTVIVQEGSSAQPSTNSTSATPPTIPFTMNVQANIGSTTISVSGTSPNTINSVTVLAPNGNIVSIDPNIQPNSDGIYSTTHGVGGPMWKQDGIYQIIVKIDDYTKLTETVFISNGAVSSPNAFSSSTNTVENAQGSSVPGCEPNCFIPATLTINPGESVTFNNNDTAAHTSTAGTPADGPSGAWDSSMVMSGQSYTTPALDEGTYPYFCMVHPWMLGTIIVGEGSATPTQEESSQAQDEAAERIAAAEAAAKAAEEAAKAAEAEAAARIAEAEAAARIAEAEAAAKAAEEAAQAAEQASQDRIEAAAVNEKIEITMDFTNDSDVQQSFALIVQIKDSNNTTISLSHVTGMLGAGQTLDQILSYTPTDPGTYTVEKFLWDNFADPTALTDSKETFTLSVS